MGPSTCRSLTVVAAGAAVCLLAPVPLLGQVFVVGMKTATADVVTEFHPTHVELPTEPLDERGRLDLVRNLEAEQGFAHRELPLGAGLTLLANGQMTPKAEEYRALLYKKGQSASPGERLQVSALQFKPDRIVVDFNGGPYAKHRFLSHIELNGMQMAPQGPAATGCRITLIFEGGVPEVTAAEVKALLDPLVDFKAKSSAEAYADTLPSKVRDAVEAHEILVGMDRRMVLASLGEPRTKHREHSSGDDATPLIEEWIYGEPPKATQFVRFHNGRVDRLEIAELGKPIQIHDKDEVGKPNEPVLQARTISNGDVARSGEGRAASAPTLRRPGEAADAAGGNGMGKVKLPADTPKAVQPATH